MPYVVKRTGQHDIMLSDGDGDHVGCEAFDETIAEGIGDLDEACRVLLDHRGLQHRDWSGFTDVSVVSAHGETVAWLDENGGLVRRESAKIIFLR